MVFLARHPERSRGIPVLNCTLRRGVPRLRCAPLGMTICAAWAEAGALLRKDRLVFRHGGINEIRPRINSAFEIIHVGETALLQ